MRRGYFVFIAAFLLMSTTVSSQKKYALFINPVDKDSVLLSSLLKPIADFPGKQECLSYIGQIIPTLNAKGYVTASIDSVQTDSVSAKVTLYIGQLYKWSSIHTDVETEKWLRNIGWDERFFENKILEYNKLGLFQQKMLDYFENNGYPFAKIYMDNMQINGDSVSGELKIKTGPLYHIDSIQVTGNAKISTEYLQNFLELKNGSVYNKEKLQRVSNLLKKLNYVEETSQPRFYWNTSGGMLEVFLQQKKSSQVNFIVGLLPNSDQLASKKILITGEALLNLRNSFGAGEIIGLNWQKLQVSSQALNVVYQQPYLFRSPFGVDFSFNMLKKDSSLNMDASYLNIDARLGTQYIFNTQQEIRVFVQQFNTIVNSVNTTHVLLTKTLPTVADVKITNLGVEYNLNTTNYIYNPVRGYELSFISAGGNKKVKPNSQVIDLKDPDDLTFDFRKLYDTVKLRSYQLRSVLIIAKYFPIGTRNRSTIKTALNGGYLMSSNIYRNELFQIGGYRLLRGFDEQSQYLSQYAIATAEYRYLLGQNSYINVFTDGGWGKNASKGVRQSYGYISGGFGMAFETKIGVFNLAWAVGKRNDSRFNLRQSKIHFGFINYF